MHKGSPWINTLSTTVVDIVVIQSNFSCSLDWYCFQVPILTKKLLRPDTTETIASSSHSQNQDFETQISRSRSRPWRSGLQIKTLVKRTALHLLKNISYYYNITTEFVKFIHITKCIKNGRQLTINCILLLKSCAIKIMEQFLNNLCHTKMHVFT